MHLSSSRLLTSGAAVLAAAALTLGGSLPASAAETDTTVSDPRSPEAREAAQIVADYVTTHPRPASPPANPPADVWNAWVAAEYEFLSGFPFVAGLKQWECTERVPTTVQLHPATDTRLASVSVLYAPKCPGDAVPQMPLILTPRLAQAQESSARD
jgi:hypothetical protein